MTRSPLCVPLVVEIYITSEDVMTRSPLCVPLVAEIYITTCPSGGRNIHYKLQGLMTHLRYLSSAHDFKRATFHTWWRGPVPTWVLSLSWGSDWLGKITGIGLEGDPFWSRFLANQRFRMKLDQKRDRSIHFAPFNEPLVGLDSQWSKLLSQKSRVISCNLEVDGHYLDPTFLYYRPQGTRFHSSVGSKQVQQPTTDLLMGAQWGDQSPPEICHFW